MSENSKIEWCDSTFNPWIGCQRVSPGCLRCYAETLDHRWGGDHWGPKAERRRTSANYWKQPLLWNEKAKKSGQPFRVFCASLADVFEDRKDLTPIREELWDLIIATPYLTWLLLTKRPENIQKMWPWGWQVPDNIWIGTTAEDQKRLEERTEHLSQLVGTRFLSCEPLLESLTLGVDCNDGSGFVEWIIAGAESGHGARPMKLEWVRSLRDQARDTGAAFFMKQLCHNGKKLAYEVFPADLQIRQFPEL